MHFILRDLPDIKDIRKLEKSAQKEGSGIIYDDLLGIWQAIKNW